MTGVQTCALPICFPVTIAGEWFAGTGEYVDWGRGVLDGHFPLKELFEKLASPGLPSKLSNEFELRKYLWLTHGHKGTYGDDGEMQCQECMRFGLWDYKREPLEKVVRVAIQARETVNFEELVKSEKEK